MRRVEIDNMIDGQPVGQPGWGPQTPFRPLGVPAASRVLVMETRSADGQETIHSIQAPFWLA
jgi:hypothetical protein